MNRKNRFFFAPDATVTTGGATPAATPPPAISAADSPTGAPIPTAPPSTQKPAEIIQPKPIVKQTGIVDVKKALGLDKKPSEMLNKEAKEIAKRARQSTIIPVPKITSKAEPKEKVETDTPGIVTEPPKPVAEIVAPVKVKIGDKEMTEEEVTKYIADLEAKAKPPEAPKLTETPKTTEPPKAEKTPEQEAAEAKKLDDDFLTRHAQNYQTTTEELDTILSGGEPAIKLFATKLAQVELGTRKWVEKTLNPILSDLHEQMEPVVAMHREVAQYQAEAKFFEKHGDLKAHQKTVRSVAAALRDKYPTEYAKMNQEERDAEIATHSRAIVKEFGGKLETPAAPPVTPTTTPVTQPAAATPKPAAPQPKPPTGNLGGAAAPTKLNEQASMVAKLMNFKR